MSLTGTNPWEMLDARERRLAREKDEREEDERPTVRALRTTTAQDSSRDKAPMLHPAFHTAVLGDSAGGPSDGVGDNNERHPPTRSTDSSLKSNISRTRPQSSASHVVLNPQEPEGIPRSPSRLSRAASRVSEAAKSVFAGKTYSNKSISSTQSTQNMIGMPHDYTRNPNAHTGVPNPAPSDPEVAKLFEEFHRWDEQTHIVNPELWQRRVRLRCFRLFQRKKGEGNESHEGEIKQGNAYTGDCLADANLFVCRFDLSEEESAVLGDDDRSSYEAMYGFTREEVMAVRGSGILIDAINKIGTLAVEENLLNYQMSHIKSWAHILFTRLTDPGLGGCDERTYSKAFLEEVLRLKKKIDKDFDIRQDYSAYMRDLKVKEDAELIRLAEEHKRPLSVSRRRSLAASNASQAEGRRNSSSSIQPSKLKPWEAPWRK